MNKRAKVPLFAAYIKCLSSGCQPTVSLPSNTRLRPVIHSASPCSVTSSLQAVHSAKHPESPLQKTADNCGRKMCFWFVRWDHVSLHTRARRHNLSRLGCLADSRLKIECKLVLRLKCECVSVCVCECVRVSGHGRECRLLLGGFWQVGKKHL